MVKRIGTTQRKSRHKLSQHYRQRGKISLSQFFKELESGDKVGLKINPNVQDGRFHTRFHGLTGTVTGKKGFCYEVAIKDGNKQKTLYVHPIHLKKQL
ncbi:50S ribosomal protein L21e [Candidatus Woesearchaeota archaeon CG_4_10_14_0_2_um_filter_33_13]|nr:MAG: 50S ribosomal protein L21e [Candidatus Woesearchaeota archaeon CG_4_10_14_0_2_um_filter_33_13]